MERGSYVRGDLAILEAGFAALDQAVLVHDERGTIVACNPAGAKLVGRPVDEILGKGPDDFEIEARYEDGTPVTPENSRLLRCLRTGKPERDVLVEILQGGPGAPRWVIATYHPLSHEGGETPWGAVSSLLPVPPGEEPHHATRRDLATQIELAPCALLAVDRDGRVAFANADARALASESDDLQLTIDAQESLAALLDDEEVAVEPVIRAGRRLSLKRSFERPDGAELWLSVDIVPLGEGASAMCALRDETDVREREEELSHRALHDSLTGLPNRRFTEEQLALALARARRNGGGVGVVFLDIDNFKGVNDELGHAAGDEVLIEFAERLAGAVRETDAIGRVAESAPLVARRGGDEFVLVLGDLPASCADLISKVIERVEAALAKPFDVSGRKLEVSASFGAAAHPYDSHDQGMLVELANSAMRAAKRRRRGVRPSEPPDAA